jgi:UDP-galactopyranose mutase
MMWEACADKVTKGGGKLVLEEKVRKIHHENGRATGVTTVVTGGYGLGAGAPESSPDRQGPHIPLRCG